MQDLDQVPFSFSSSRKPLWAPHSNSAGDLYSLAISITRCIKILMILMFHAGFAGEALALGFGMMFDHLEAEGISRDSIKHVLVTHGHFDHLAGSFS